MPYITPLEMMYRQVSTPSPPETKPARVTDAKKIELKLTRADVDEIIQRKRPASGEELQFILDNAKDLRVTIGEKNQISVDLTVAVARRARLVRGRREDPASRFMSETLGLTETPYGLVSREWVNSQLQTGAQAISRCRNHRPPCQCWTASRVTLWQAQANEPKSPEAWAAARILESLEALELASRPERVPGVG
jgi:hypothetical protein